MGTSASITLQTHASAPRHVECGTIPLDLVLKTECMFARPGHYPQVLLTMRTAVDEAPHTETTAHARSAARLSSSSHRVRWQLLHPARYSAPVSSPPS